MKHAKITAHDHEYFKHGSCSALAAAIHKHTGWPAYATHDYTDRIPYKGKRTKEKDKKYSNKFLRHAYVRNPDKKAVDISGVHKTSHCTVVPSNDKHRIVETKPIGLKELRQYHTPYAERKAMSLITKHPEVFGIAKKL